MRLYESMWIIDPGRTKDDFAKVRADLASIIEKAGGTIVNCERWDERRLAYGVRDINNRRHKRGLYVIAHFNAEADVPAKLERQAQITEYVLRLLVVKDADGLTTSVPEPSEEEMDFEPERMGSYRSSAWKKIKKRVASQYAR
jgi:ribosomal protein S6